LHDVEDDTIRLYLSAAIDGISTIGGNDINMTQYDVFYPYTPDYSFPSTLLGWYCGKWDISDVEVYSEVGIDVSGDYTIDFEHGMIYPHPLSNKVTFKVGYATSTDVPPHLKTIIFRYGAHLFENRESVRVGEPKLIPDWVNYALASIWKPRV
jgi:hypothetical protein